MTIEAEIMLAMETVGATLLRVIEPDDPIDEGERLEVWQKDGRTVIVQVYGGGNGWDLYLRSAGNTLGDTDAALERYFLTLENER